MREKDKEGKEEVGEIDNKGRIVENFSDKWEKVRCMELRIEGRWER